MWPIPHPVQLHCVAGGPRTAALASASDAISAAGGWVEDVHLFSDLSACLLIELPASCGPALAAALVDASLAIDGQTHDALVALPEKGTEDVSMTLEVTFKEGHGDLRHEVPAVPG